MIYEAQTPLGPGMMQCPTVQ